MKNYEIVELNDEQLEQVTGGRRKPFVRATGNSVNVRSGPGTDYPVVARLGYLDMVPATGEVRKDKHGTWWAKVTTPVNQNTYVTGWVCRKYAEPCWH